MNTETTAAANEVGDQRLVRRSLDFQPYEIEIILEALKDTAYAKLSKCPWVKQEGGGYCYKPSKEVKRLRFIERSINRQLSEENSQDRSSQSD